MPVWPQELLNDLGLSHLTPQDLLNDGPQQEFAEAVQALSDQDKKALKEKYKSG